MWKGGGADRRNQPDHLTKRPTLGVNTDACEAPFCSEGERALISGKLNQKENGTRKI